MAKRRASVIDPFARLLTTVALLALTTSCAPTNSTVLLHQLGERFPFYACVPLGWIPVISKSYYYPGFSSENDDTGWWLPPTWTAIITPAELKAPAARTEYSILNRLVGVHMLQRQPIQSGYQYWLTWSARQYYYDGDEFGNNPLHEPFLCYSRIVPQRITTEQPIHVERYGREDDRLFRVAFDWSADTPADWLNDAGLRDYGAILAPALGSLRVTVVDERGVWNIHYVPTTALPMLGFTNRSSWTARHP